MDAKEIEAIRKPVLDALEKLNVPLSAMALLKIANEFYTKEERTNLYGLYKQLQETDKKAYDHMEAASKKLDAATPKDIVGLEARIERFGEDEANAQLAESRQMREIRKSTLKELTDFERKHRLIIRLLEVKETLSKGRYD